MATTKKEKAVNGGKAAEEFVKAAHPGRPDWPYLLPQDNEAARKKLEQRPAIPPECTKACTKVIELLPKTLIKGKSGVGYFMINVDGYRTINAFVISDPLNSSTQRGFTLELSFSVFPFVLNVGVIGETSFFYNFESYFHPGVLAQPTLDCKTSDLTTVGGLSWIGGVSYAHILRAPVMGPYVRASVFNEDSTARNVQVQAYMST